MKENAENDQEAVVTKEEAMRAAILTKARKPRCDSPLRGLAWDRQREIVQRLQQGFGLNAMVQELKTQDDVTVSMSALSKFCRWFQARERQFREQVQEGKRHQQEGRELVTEGPSGAEMKRFYQFANLTAGMRAFKEGDWEGLARMERLFIALRRLEVRERAEEVELLKYQAQVDAESDETEMFVFSVQKECERLKKEEEARQEEKRREQEAEEELRQEKLRQWEELRVRQAEIEQRGREWEERRTKREDGARRVEDGKQCGVRTGDVGTIEGGTVAEKIQDPKDAAASTGESGAVVNLDVAAADPAEAGHSHAPIEEKKETALERGLRLGTLQQPEEVPWQELSTEMSMDDLVRCSFWKGWYIEKSQDGYLLRLKGDGRVRKIVGELSWQPDQLLNLIRTIQENKVWLL